VNPLDVHQYGDLALTKYYRPDDDIGLGAEWEEQAALLATAGLGREMLLGHPLGPAGGQPYFDPGKMGSYFQSMGEVRDQLRQLDRLGFHRPEIAKQVQPVRTMLDQAASAGSGLYVTF
jgi:hypothetical protein